MNYEDLIINLAQRTGFHTEIVRKVLYHLPDALTQMTVGDIIRTPLGAFRMVRNKARTIKMPDGVTTAKVPEKTFVKLRSGSRLKIEVD